VAVRTGLGINDIIGDKRGEILGLAAKHGAYNVRVFGSVARGEAGPESDVDFLVEWDMSRISAWGGAAFDLDLKALLSRAVDVVTLEDLHPMIRQRVLSEAVSL
jgi:uncharacterized protein